jgi:hypothetical protein
MTTKTQKAKETKERRGEASEVERRVSLTLSEARSLLEHCWSATSKLESQVGRNPSLPDGYSETVKLSLNSLHKLHARIIAS